MNSILITGSSGFVGSNLVRYLENLNFKVKRAQVRGGGAICIYEDAIIHLAGKAHDLKNTSKPDEYYQVNTELTKIVFDAFLASKAKLFITFSSVKAVADEMEGELTEEHVPNPITHYGKSKLLAEQYILSKEVPVGKRVYILRPCMIHGPGNKGNLNLLYMVVTKGLPWPLGAYKNNRSFCSIDNLLFIINELIVREDIPSGIYNVSDNEPISTNSLILLIAKSINKKVKIFNIPPGFISVIAKLGDKIKLPLNSERLGKLTQNYIVSNKKLIDVIGKELPVNAIEGMKKTLASFN